MRYRLVLWGYALSSSTGINTAVKPHANAFHNNIISLFPQSWTILIQKSAGKRAKMLKYFHFSAEKVQREIEAALEPSHLISYEDRKKLPYTNAVIHEALRYSNVTSIGVPRQCVRNTTLLGFYIKKVQKHGDIFLKL